MHCLVIGIDPSLLIWCFSFQNYETTESRVKREFEAYGPIKRVGILEHPSVTWVVGKKFYMYLTNAKLNHFLLSTKKCIDDLTKKDFPFPRSCTQSKETGENLMLC